MTGIIREFTTNGYARSMSFETKDMFSNNNNKTIKSGCFIMRCESVPCGTYPTWYRFLKMNTTIGKFVFENGLSEIIIGNHKFIIDIRDDVDNDIEYTETFKEAYFKCLMEDEMYN